MNCVACLSTYVRVINQSLWPLLAWMRTRNVIPALLWPAQLDLLEEWCGGHNCVCVYSSVYSAFIRIISDDEYGHAITWHQPVDNYYNLLTTRRIVHPCKHPMIVPKMWNCMETKKDIREFLVDNRKSHVFATQHYTTKPVEFVVSLHCPKLKLLKLGVSCFHQMVPSYVRHESMCLSHWWLIVRKRITKCR